MTTALNPLHVALDEMTDTIIPTIALALKPWLDMTDKDRDDLSDWLQDRFRLRIEVALEIKGAHA